jgi:hypothetical protein
LQELSTLFASTSVSVMSGQEEGEFLVENPIVGNGQIPPVGTEAPVQMEGVVDGNPVQSEVAPNGELLVAMEAAFATERAKMQAEIARLKAEAMGKSKAKRADPSKFTAQPGSANIDVWLRRVHQHCVDSGDAPSTFVATATSYLDLGPWNYWDAAKRSGQFSDTQATEWATFSNVMREGFGAEDLERIARRKLDTFVQGSLSAREYVVQFKQLVADIPKMDDGTKLDHFKKGLNPHLLAAVCSDPAHGKHWNDLSRFQTFISTRDDTWRDLPKAKSSAVAGVQQSSTATAHQSARSAGVSHGRRPGIQKKSFPYRKGVAKQVAMLLHALQGSAGVQKPKGKFAKGKSSVTTKGPFHGQKGVCWQCGATDHLRDVCPKMPKN